MTKHLKKPSRGANSGHVKRRPKGLSRRLVRRSLGEGGSCKAAKAGWSPERRARQAELIRSWQPWQKSTGPRTPEGKERSAANALKHGFRSRAHIETVREDRRVLRLAAHNIATAKAFLRTLSAKRGSIGPADISIEALCAALDPAEKPDLIDGPPAGSEVW